MVPHDFYCLWVLVANDPRGSWSDFVGAWELSKFGPATRVNTKRSLAHDLHDHQLRQSAKLSLKYPPVRFDAIQRQAIADGFALAIAESNYTFHGMCIGHDHVHGIVGRHARTIEQIGRHLKSKATMELSRRGIHPLKDHADAGGVVPTPWAAKLWSVFINDEAQLRAAVGYVERHPAKEGLAPQRFEFVRPHDLSV